MGSAARLYHQRGLISHAKITELPTWRRGDDGVKHYCHGNMRWEWELPVWYCTVRFSSQDRSSDHCVLWKIGGVEGWAVWGGESAGSFCADACRWYNLDFERRQGFRNKPISTAELNFKECFNGMNSFEKRSDMSERTRNVSALHICTQEN